MEAEFLETTRIMDIMNVANLPWQNAANRRRFLSVRPGA